MMPARSNLTDRAKRYRAQSAVYGARRCVLCGARGRLDVMHLDGNEANEDPRNMAYGCRSCNGKLAAAFKRIGAGVATNQYNPRGGGIPTFSQYCWAVSQQQHSGEHGAAGAMIHATPKSKRIEYAQRIADLKGSRFSERWNPMAKRNIWPFGAGQPLGSRTTHRSRTSRPAVSSKAAQRQEREREAQRLEGKLGARDLHAQLQRHYSRGGTLAEFLQANPGLRPIANLYRKLENLVKQIGRETRTSKLAALLDDRQRIERELARFGFPVNPGKVAKSAVACRICGQEYLVRDTNPRILAGKPFVCSKPVCERQARAQGINPGSGAFERCVESVSEKGGGYDPRAVCAAAGRKKYGAKRFQKMALAGRERAARGNPAWVVEKVGGKWTVLSRHTDAQDARDTAAALKRSHPERQIGVALTLPLHQNVPVDPTVAAMIGSELGKFGGKLRKKATRNPAYALGDESGHTLAGYDRQTDAFRDARALAESGQRVEVVWKTRKGYQSKWFGPRRNPAEAAAAMSERFHGRPVTEVLDIEEQVHYHEHLAVLGELERLKVKALDGGIVTLTGFDGALLCSNENGVDPYEVKGTQLYIRGGDQSVDLAQFAVEKPYHDFEDLGEVLKLWYFTTKDHLGDQGGTASYHHTLSEEDFKRRGTRTRRPRLQYSIRDQLLSFSGGRYTVEDEGIRN